MKHKKLLIAGIVVTILLIIAALFLLNQENNTNFTIPDDYLAKFENHLSHVDGPDIDYYIYQDKIIVDEKSYYPLEHPAGTTYERTTTLYDNLTIDDSNLNDYHAIIEGKKGKTVLHIKE